MVEVKITPADTLDAQLVARRMREVDVEEVWAASRYRPLEALLHALDVSVESWALYFNDEIGAVWGVAPVSDTFLGGRVGCVWMLTTATLEEHKAAFMRICYSTMQELMDRWDLLVNRIDARHTKSIRWGRRLGFVYADEPEAFGEDGLAFLSFRITKEALRCATQR